MEIKVNKSDKILELIIKGDINSLTAGSFESTVRENIDGVEHLVLDFKDAPYISSAGLRVILAAKKSMGDSSIIDVINANPEVKEIFNITGFDEMINIK